MNNNGGGNEKLLPLHDKIDRNNNIIILLLLELYRLRNILKRHRIDPISGKKIKKNTLAKNINTDRKRK